MAEKVRGLLEGDTVDSLAAPNHLIPAGVTGRNMFPLMGLQLVHEDSSRYHAFVHPRYGNYYSNYWNNIPPSWMDPVLLSDMARKDPAVLALLQKAVKANKKQPYQKALAKELSRVFEEKYLPWLIEQFGQTQDLVAEWLLTNAADRKLQAEELERSSERFDNRRRRKKRPRQKK